MLFLNSILNFPSSEVINLSHTSLITPQPWRSRRRTLSAGWEEQYRWGFVGKLARIGLIMFVLKIQDWNSDKHQPEKCSYYCVIGPKKWRKITIFFPKINQCRIALECCHQTKELKRHPQPAPVMVLAGMKGRLPYCSMTKSGYLVSST